MKRAAGLFLAALMLTAAPRARAADKESKEAEAEGRRHFDAG